MIVSKEETVRLLVGCPRWRLNKEAGPGTSRLYFTGITLMVSQLPLTIAEARSYALFGGGHPAIRGVYACIFLLSTSFYNVSCIKTQCLMGQGLFRHLYTRELFTDPTTWPVEIFAFNALRVIVDANGRA